MKGVNSMPTIASSKHGAGSINNAPTGVQGVQNMTDKRVNQ
jgi:hypothetical protein